MIRLSVICIFVVLLNGCVNESSNTSSSFKSSANEVIVYEKGETFEKLDAVEILRIRDEDVSPLLGRLNQVKVLSNGSILAFDAATVRIHHFDNNGNFLSSFGSSGKGPGEFSEEAVIQVYNDEIFVFERLDYKIEKFTYQESRWFHTESIPLKNIDSDLPWSFLKIDDEFIWMQYRHTKENEKGVNLSVHHVTAIARNDTTTIETWLVTLPEIDLMFEDLGGFVASYPIPYTPRPIVSITSDNDIIIARSDEFSFLRTTADTTNLATLSTLPIENIRLTSQEKENMTGFAERIHPMVRENMPAFRPAVIGRVIPDDKNGFWAGYMVVDQSDNRWLYFDELGNIRNETYLPNTYTPHAFIDDIFYGLESDMDGLNSVKAYQINFFSTD